ncbi:MAG TPA: transketolase [Nitrosospira sp.]|nr:transketolase [Nitrosospira sp.]
MNEHAQLDWLCINTVRGLSIDAVEKANSGHPGTPMGAAPTAYCLWQRFLRYDPHDPEWSNRDRFILSSGHASALLYSLLYLSEVKATSPQYENRDRLAVTMEDLKTFRQAGSRCTGHPEYGWTSGVETTTGPLGQGVAVSVGMAIAESWLAATYNRPGFSIFEYNVYALCSDGDMMEGISAEAASLAGHLKLANLCWIYDENRITIEGSTDLTFTEDVAGRFASYGWNVEHVGDANDLTLLTQVYETFLATNDRPTLIMVSSHIGYGAPHKQDTREAHGEPLGPEEARLAKEFYGRDPNSQFYVPNGVREHFAANSGERGRTAHSAWQRSFEAYRAQYPDLAEQIDCMQQRGLPAGWESTLPTFPDNAKGLATRESSGKVLSAIAEHVPWLLGGAADLAPSTKTELKGELYGHFQPPEQYENAKGSYRGRNFHFGLREHAMCAIASGMCLSKLRPYAASFLVFSDYGRAALRLSAMMEIPVIYIWTHDSISLGEDGPTHQPISHLASLRATPGMITLRPGDANEVVEAWRFLMQVKDRPVCLILTRQAVPTLDRSRYSPASGLCGGAYILADAEDGKPDVLLLATGSEVSLCITAYEQLKSEGIQARVVSMPSWELFENQDQEYRDKVLPPGIKARVAVEEASSFGWERYAGVDGCIIAMHGFGLSAPAKIVAQCFGFEPAHIVTAAKEQLAQHA